MVKIIRYADLKRDIEFKEVEIEIYELKVKRLVKDLKINISTESFRLIANEKARLVRKKKKCIKQLDQLKTELEVKELEVKELAG